LFAFIISSRHATGTARNKTVLQPTQHTPDHPIPPSQQPDTTISQSQPWHDRAGLYVSDRRHAIFDGTRPQPRLRKIDSSATFAATVNAKLSPSEAAKETVFFLAV
jgi:hypothetical protein